jgi:cell division protein FtsL
VNARVLVLIIFLAAVVGTALGVVYTRHQSRHLSVELGSLEQDRDAAMAEWSRLQLEQAYLADAGGIEQKARTQLGMTVPEESRILVVRQ